MCTKFSPPVRMNSSWTSAITSAALRHSVPDSHTPGPKLHHPLASGGDTGTRKTSGLAVKPSGTVSVFQMPIGRYSTLPAWTDVRFSGVA